MSDPRKVQIGDLVDQNGRTFRVLKTNGAGAPIAAEDVTDSLKTGTYQPANPLTSKLGDWRDAIQGGDVSGTSGEHLLRQILGGVLDVGARPKEHAPMLGSLALGTLGTMLAPEITLPAMALRIGATGAGAMAGSAVRGDTPEKADSEAVWGMLGAAVPEAVMGGAKLLGKAAPHAAATALAPTPEDLAAIWLREKGPDAYFTPERARELVVEQALKRGGTHAPGSSAYAQHEQVHNIQIPGAIKETMIGQVPLTEGVQIAPWSNFNDMLKSAAVTGGDTAADASGIRKAADIIRNRKQGAWQDPALQTGGRVGDQAPFSFGQGTITRPSHLLEAPPTVLQTAAPTPGWQSLVSHSRGGRLQPEGRVIDITPSARVENPNAHIADVLRHQETIPGPAHDLRALPTHYMERPPVFLGSGERVTPTSGWADSGSGPGFIETYRGPIGRGTAGGSFIPDMHPVPSLMHTATAGETDAILGNVDNLLETAYLERIKNMGAGRMAPVTPHERALQTARARMNEDLRTMVPPVRDPGGTGLVTVNDLNTQIADAIPWERMASRATGGEKTPFLRASTTQGGWPRFALVESLGRRTMGRAARPMQAAGQWAERQVANPKARALVQALLQYNLHSPTEIR